jgi:hypothetical protein
MSSKSTSLIHPLQTGLPGEFRRYGVQSHTFVRRQSVSAILPPQARTDIAIDENDLISFGIAQGAMDPAVCTPAGSVPAQSPTPTYSSSFFL